MKTFCFRRKATLPPTLPPPTPFIPSIPPPTPQRPHTFPPPRLWGTKRPVEPPQTPYPVSSHTFLWTAPVLHVFATICAHFICMPIRPPTPAPTPKPVPTPRPGTPVPTPVPTPGPTLPRQTPYPVSTVYWEFPAAPTLSPFSSLRNTGVKDCLHVGAYFHRRRRIRTRIPTQIPVLCRIFPLVRTLIPCLKCSKIEMDICPWDEHLSPKWVQ